MSTPELPLRAQGTISDWKEGQGFGFITPDTGGERVFVQQSAFMARKRQPVVGARVAYELAAHKKRGVCASKVSMHVASTRAANARAGSASWAAMFFLSLLAAITFKGYLPAAILGLYLLASVIAYFAYAIDKSAARAGRWRTRESTLHLFDLVGGWPGGLLAQARLRHKSGKGSFQIMFWMTVLANCAGLAWLLSTGGKALLLRFF